MNKICGTDQTSVHVLPSTVPTTQETTQDQLETYPPRAVTGDHLKCSSLNNNTQIRLLVDLILPPLGSSMAAALKQSWSARNFFPPQPVDIPESPVPAAIAQRLWGDNYDQCELSIPSPVSAPVSHLDAQNSEHILLAAQRLAHGGLVLATANGHVVCLGDADRPELLPVLAIISGRYVQN